MLEWHDYPACEEEKWREEGSQKVMLHNAKQKHWPPPTHTQTHLIVKIVFKTKNNHLYKTTRNLSNMCVCLNDIYVSSKVGNSKFWEGIESPRVV